MKTLLSLQNISIGYHDKVILQDINANLFEKSIVAVMGENGIGKSCLLKSIAGFLPLKKGKIIINGQELTSFSSKEFAQTVAVVLTEKIHIDFLKVSELVALGRSPYTNAYGTMTKQDLDCVKEVLDLLNISELGNLYFSDLSDGQKQKVLIARALAQDPKLLILDEPATYLDIPSRIDLMKTFRKISKEKGIGIIFSTHDADLAHEFSNHIWHIDNKRQLNEEIPANVKKLFIKSEPE